MTIRVINTIFLVIISKFIFGQDCSAQKINFKSGETVSYRAVYNWGFIWVNAGDVVFRVSDTTYMNQPALYFKAQGWSLKQYDWFYKVRDKFESIVNPTSLLPYWFERNTSEGGYNVFNRYIFKHPEKTVDIISQTSERPYRRDIVAQKGCTFDVLSAIYYCRTLNFDKYKVGEKIPLAMAVDNEVFELFIRYKGKEKLKTRDGNEYNTIRFSALLVEGTIFKGGEDLDVWVSDDENRVPILVEAKILVGSVKAVLTGTEGLMYKSILK